MTQIKEEINSKDHGNLIYFYEMSVHWTRIKNGRRELFGTTIKNFI